jgi:hypothetical protein
MTSENREVSAGPAVVLIHGLWMTPLSFDETSR